MLLEWEPHTVKTTDPMYVLHLYYLFVAYGQNNLLKLSVLEMEQ